MQEIIGYSNEAYLVLRVYLSDPTYPPYVADQYFTTLDVTFKDTQNNEYPATVEVAYPADIDPGDEVFFGDVAWLIRIPESPIHSLPESLDVDSPSPFTVMTLQFNKYADTDSPNREFIETVAEYQMDISNLVFLYRPLEPEPEPEPAT